MSNHKQRLNTGAIPPALTGPEVAHFSMSEVARFSMSLDTGKDPRDLKRQEQQEALPQHSGPTLQTAAESFLTHSSTRERTKQGYRNML